ncbi:MAG: LysM peptidoglycan-binding domain-containing protein, partial [Acidimicrobiales bacterium]
TAATGHYTVRPGDTLSAIASRHGVTSSALATANGISDPNRIFAGRTLSLPGSAAGAAGSYTIRPGDTLSGIASRHGTTTAALATANGITDRNRIVIGRALSVPSAASGADADPPASTAGARSGLPAALQASPERLAYVPIFEHWAGHYDVPADLLMAMTWLESGWQRTVVSPAGAVGIGQLMPDTTTWMRDIIIREDLDPLRPEDNIRMSARYLRWLLERTDGDVRLALGGYYQGLNAVRSRGLLPTTERYVADILAFRDRNF